MRQMLAVATALLTFTAAAPVFAEYTVSYQQPMNRVDSIIAGVLQKSQMLERVAGQLNKL